MNGVAFGVVKGGETSGPKEITATHMKLDAFTLQKDPNGRVFYGIVEGPTEGKVFYGGAEAGTST